MILLGLIEQYKFIHQQQPDQGKCPSCYNTRLIVYFSSGNSSNFSSRLCDQSPTESCSHLRKWPSTSRYFSLPGAHSALLRSKTTDSPHRKSAYGQNSHGSPCHHRHHGQRPAKYHPGAEMTPPESWLRSRSATV